MKIREFRTEDINQLECQEVDTDNVFSLELAEVISQHPSFTLIKGNTIIAMFGIILYAERTAIGWILPSIHVKNGNSKSFCSYLKEYIALFETTFGLNKIITDCINDVQRIRFIQWLGFKESHEKGIYIKEV